jgi:hypothetical protein
MSDDRPVQHTPKHLDKDSEVFDPRHPAASAFAVAQPGAGVVADDVPERGQNLLGGTSAADASGEYADQKEVLAEQHARTLRERSGVSGGRVAAKVEGDSAKAVSSKDDDAKGRDAAKSEPKPAQSRQAPPSSKP